MIAVTEIGWKARQALARTGGSARLLAALSESTYLSAGDEIVWLGRPDAARHGRAILGEPGDGADVLAFDLGRAGVWRPPPVPAAPRATLVASAAALVGALGEMGGPQGFGALLLGRTPPAPLDRALDAALALAQACARDDARAAAGAAEALVGLGPGLTPAGDDYVGGAFFARAIFPATDGGEAEAWGRARAAVLALARERTHPVSAALLADLVEGQAWAPLHDLAQGLAAGAAVDALLPPARRLTRLGHSSGWDLLAGFLGTILGARGR